MGRKETTIVSTNIQAARDGWNNNGLNRGADPEVLADIGVITPDLLPDVVARVLEEHGVIGLETTDNQTNTNGGRNQKTGKPKPAWGGRPPSNHELAMADKNLSEASFPNGTKGAPPRVPAEAILEDPPGLSPETDQLIREHLQEQRRRREAREYRHADQDALDALYHE